MLEIGEMELFRVADTAQEVPPTKELSLLGQYVALLDAEKYDQLYIEIGHYVPRQRYLGMYGGEDGRVVLFIRVPDEFYYLRNADADDSNDVTEVSSGGCLVPALERWRNPVDRAARGLYYFLLTGELDPALSWDCGSELDPALLS